jgi:hypothetical protein
MSYEMEQWSKAWPGEQISDILIVLDGVSCSNKLNSLNSRN